jgi:hypothetical protein
MTNLAHLLMSESLKVSARAKKNLHHCGTTGGPRATSSQRLLVTSAAKLFCSLFPVSTTLFMFLTSKNLGEKIVILISSAASHTRAALAID